MKLAQPNSRSVGQTYYLWLKRTWGSVVLRMRKNCAFARILFYNHTWALRSLCLPLFSQFCTPKHVVKALPLLMITKNSKLLAPGYQCRLCLKSFCLGQYTRLLPCSHKVKAMSFYLTFSSRAVSHEWGGRRCFPFCFPGCALWHWLTQIARADKMPQRTSLAPRDKFTPGRTCFLTHCLVRIHGILTAFFYILLLHVT